jgi:hypothetical protein
LKLRTALQLSAKKTKKEIHIKGEREQKVTLLNARRALNDIFAANE